MYPSRVLLALAKQRAKRFGIPFSITEDDIKIPEKCPALGMVLKHGTGHRKIPESPTLDRIDPKMGYIPGNVVVISNLANAIKSNADYLQIGEVYRWLKRLTRRKDRARS